jgi:hypothetical protein
MKINNQWQQWRNRRISIENERRNGVNNEEEMVRQQSIMKIGSVKK